MRVYYLGATYESCYYVRCMLPLQSNGWDGDRPFLTAERANMQTIIQGAMASDIVVFHRPIQKELLNAALALKKQGKKIVMDNDDTYKPNSGVPVNMFGKDKDNLNKAINMIDENLKEFMKIADLVTVTTEYLKKEYEQYNKNVIVLPNCVDPFDWPLPKPNTTGKIRLGVVGSVASNKDYEPIIPLLDSLKDRSDVQLVLLALPPDKEGFKEARKIYAPEIEFWSKYKPEWHPFVAVKDYMKYLNDLTIDIMLIPRHDNYFNRCKSNVKFLEASMCGMATVAQSFPDGNSPYEVNPKDRENLILATNSEDWVEKVNDLINNPKKLEKLKKKAHKYVKKTYDIENLAYLWKNAYNTIK